MEMLPTQPNETISEEDIAMLEELVAQAKAMEDEKQRAMDALAQEVERAFLERQSARSTKEAEWTTSQDLHMGKLANSKVAYLFPENDLQRAENSRNNGKYRVNIVRPKVDAIVSNLVA